MLELDFLFLQTAYLQTPIGWVDWFGWFALVAVVIYLQKRWQGFRQEWSNTRLWILIILGVLVPVTSLLLPGINWLGAGISQSTQASLESGRSFIMIFSGLPWVLAAGLVGILPAGCLALFSGLLLALWNTHNLFFPLEMALLATVFTGMIQQNFRTRIFEVMRHPFIAALITGMIYIPLYFIDMIFVAQGLLADRLDAAISQFGTNILSVGGSLVIAGLFAEVIARAQPSLWINVNKLQPSPAEKSLETRFLYSIAPVAFLLTIVLMVGDWAVTSGTTTQILANRMSNVAEIASQSVPIFMESGQNLLDGLALNPLLVESSKSDLSKILGEEILTVPYFTQLIVFDRSGSLLGSYPNKERDELGLTLDELNGVDLALNQVVLNQTFTIPPKPGARAATISFLTAIQPEVGAQPIGAIIGRSDLSENLFGKQLLASLESLLDIQGKGILIDEHGRIIYHPDPNKLMTYYSGRTDLTSTLFRELPTDEAAQWKYIASGSGRGWSVIMSVPVRYTQQQAINIATPLLFMIIISSILMVIFMRYGLGRVTDSLRTLAVDADRMSQGQLDIPLHVSGEDEVGQLGKAFEKMRKSLEDRLDELNRLLLVSQGVASNLELEESLKPVLKSGLVNGAASVRVVLAPSVVPDLDVDKTSSPHFSMGPAGDTYRYLDDQILTLTRRQDRLILTNMTRPRILAFSRSVPHPSALIAVALRHENLFYGVLWIAFDQSHQFEDQEIRYITTLASQAAIAVANAHLFSNAEIGRQRLEAILASTPDPVLVTNSKDRLLLANPAAWQTLGINIEASRDQPIQRIISLEPLVKLMLTSSKEKQSAEVVLPDGQILLATTSTVVAEGRRMGRVCILRDVTQFKKLDALKSEFVSTVSHDLRSPLTLIRGYSTMLKMVGELNDQQSNYLEKIADGVENMDRLVNNLLDLSRIEAGIGLQLEKISVQEVVERIVSEFQSYIDQKRIKLTVAIEEGEIPLVEVDKALLRQAFHNLVENAIKFTEPGGNIQIRLLVHEDQLVFEVEDTGIGISPADQQRMFEKFYRASRQSVISQRGSGLGLAIVKSIAERHGGRVWFESQLGKGSTFFLAIPLQQTQSEPALD